MKYYCDNNRHLICVPYSIDNLHEMARNLDIKKCWYHNSNPPHYDIPKKRIDEIKSKCEVISSKELLKIVFSELKRQTGDLKEFAQQNLKLLNHGKRI